MDFNGNDYVGQCNQSEESSPEALKVVRKTQQTVCEEKSGRRSSIESVKTTGSYDCTQKQGHCQEPDREGGRCWKMCEHERGGGCLENFPNENVANFNDENIWRYTDCDNFGSANTANEFNVNRNNNHYGNCKSGVNISIVSHRETSADKKDMTVPKYNVSFKRCYESNPNWDSKWRKCMNFLTTSKMSCNVNDNKPKKSRKCEDWKRNDDVRTMADRRSNIENTSNYRCTFESCCGNCDSYMTELPHSSFDCQNWQNMNYEYSDPCIEDCCCPRETKLYSSTLNVTSANRAQRSCTACMENRKCCGSTEPECDFLENDCRGPSKHCLQRMHFSKPNCARTNHSTCSFCSRKCTPSKASLFVEIGESVADVCDLRGRRSSQPLQFSHESADSLGDRLEGDVCTAVRRNKSDLLRKRSKKCDSNCKTKGGTAECGNSNRVVSMDNCCYDEHSLTNCDSRVRNVRSNLSFQKKQRCRDDSGSNACLDNGTVDCNKQCETMDASLWEGIRKSKLWFQVQETYKSLVKIATTAINSKFKHLKKETKRSSMVREKNDSCTDECSHSTLCEDRLHERTCWEETVPDDLHCCQNVCFSLNESSKVDALPECQKLTCQTDCCKYYHNPREQTLSNRGWQCDPWDGGVQGNVHPSKCLEHSLKRERGGSDGNNTFPGQTRKYSNSGRRANQNAWEQSGPSNNRGNPNGRNQTRPRQTGNPEGQTVALNKQKPLTSYGQSKRATFVDVQVQATKFHSEIDSTTSPIVMQTVAYRRKIQAVTHIDTQADSNVDDLPGREQYMPATSTPIIEEVHASTSPREDPKTAKKQTVPQPKKLNGRTSGANGKLKTDNGSRTAPSTPRKPSKDMSFTKSPGDSNVNGVQGTSSDMLNKEIQCEIIKQQQVLCADKKGVELASQTDESCICPPTTKDATEETVGTPPPISNGTKTDEQTSEPTDEQTPAPTDEQTPAPTDEQTPAPTDEQTPAPTDEQTSAPTDEGDLISEPDNVEDTEETDAASTESPHTATSEEDVPGEKSAGEDDGLVSLPTYYGSVDTAGEPEIVEDATLDDKELDETKVTAVTPVDPKQKELSNMPIEFSREFNGRRNHVSVEMQTSSTILTKILSEYQIGNKKRKILMSIKLQTTLDGDNGEQVQPEARVTEVQTGGLHPPPVVTNQRMNSVEYSSDTVTPKAGMEINGQTERNDEIEYSIQATNAASQPPASDDIDGNQKRWRKPSAGRPVYPRRKLKDGTDPDVCTGAPTSNDLCRNSERQPSGEAARVPMLRKYIPANHDRCSGACGKRKL